jgi:hypothetical protein
MNDQNLTAVEYLLQQINSGTSFTEEKWKCICDVALAMEKSQTIQAEIKAVTEIYKIKNK